MPQVEMTEEEIVRRWAGRGGFVVMPYVVAEKLAATYRASGGDDKEQLLLVPDSNVGMSYAFREREQAKVA